MKFYIERKDKAPSKFWFDANLFSHVLLSLFTGKETERSVLSDTDIEEAISTGYIGASVDNKGNGFRHYFDSEDSKLKYMMKCL